MSTGKGTIQSHLGVAQYDVTIRTESDRVAAQITQLEGRIAALDATAIPDKQAAVNNAKTELDAARQAMDSAIDSHDEDLIRQTTQDTIAASRTYSEQARLLAMLEMERESAVQRLAYLATHDPAEQTTSLWCADRTETLTGDVELIYPNADPKQTPVIAPDAIDGAGWDTAAGIQQSAVASTPAGAWYNRAIQPAAQKNLITYRTGTLTAVDVGGAVADVTLEPATGEQGIDLNINSNLSAVPVLYMTCNAQAFDVGDEVMVAFDQDQQNPTVIGFKGAPKPCEFLLAAYFKYSDGATETEHWADVEVTGWTETGPKDTPPPLDTTNEYRRDWYSRDFTERLDWACRRPYRGAEFRFTHASPGTYRHAYHNGLGWITPDYLHGCAITYDTATGNPWLVMAHNYIIPETPIAPAKHAVKVFGKPMLTGVEKSVSAGFQYLTDTMTETPDDLETNKRWRLLGDFETFTPDEQGFVREKVGSCMPEWFFNGSGNKAIGCLFFSSANALKYTDPHQRERTRVYEITITGIATSSPSVILQEINVSRGTRTYKRLKPYYYVRNENQAWLDTDSDLCLAADYKGDQRSFITVKGTGSLSESPSGAVTNVEVDDDGTYKWYDRSWRMDNTAGGSHTETLYFNGAAIMSFYEYKSHAEGFWEINHYRYRNTGAGIIYDSREAFAGGGLYEFMRMPYIVALDARTGLVSLLCNEKKTTMTGLPIEPPSDLVLYPPVDATGSNEVWRLQTKIGAFAAQDKVIKQVDGVPFLYAVAGGFFSYFPSPPAQFVNAHYARQVEWMRGLDYFERGRAAQFEDPETDDEASDFYFTGPVTKPAESVLQNVLDENWELESFSAVGETLKTTAFYLRYKTPSDTGLGESFLYLNPAGGFTADTGATHPSLNDMFGEPGFPGTKIVDLVVKK